MDVTAGRISDVPDDRCVAIGDGRAVVVRVDDEVVAFPNRCLHQDSELADGRVFDGRLQCPAHFWRYHLPGGEHVGGEGRLQRLPVRVEDGHVVVDLPDPEPVLSMRERLLAHARDWDRDAPPRPPSPRGGDRVADGTPR